jgi:hypothetical protein
MAGKLHDAAVLTVTVFFFLVVVLRLLEVPAWYLRVPDAVWQPCLRIMQAACCHGSCLSGVRSIAYEQLSLA